MVIRLFMAALSLWRVALLSSLVATPITASAHELRPSVADLTIGADTLTLEIELNLEALLAGIDLSAHDDTTASPEAADYDQLRQMPPDDLAAQFEASWPEIAQGLTLRSGDAPLDPRLTTVAVPEIGDVDLPRDSRITLVANQTPGSGAVTVGWIAAYGPLVLRQLGIENGYTAYLDNGALSAPIPRSGTVDRDPLAVFGDYIVLGFEHILPKGLDHILFVLGLFFLSLKLGPLLWQISAFTVAHTITLALGILGVVTLPAALVEPLIAASIAYVGIENVFSRGLTPWRPVIVFLFGLLHGLGFASVLGEIGLDPGTFVTSLIGFNLGVEFGQLTVIAIAYLAVGFWFGGQPWYRSRIAVPASLAIAAVGLYWTVERTLL